MEIDEWKEDECLNEEDLYCGFCDVEFENNDEYEFHNHLHHENECSNCKRKFPTEKMLEIHIMESHDNLYKLRLARNESKFECLHKGCQMLFDNPRDRFNHLISFHDYAKSSIASFDTFQPANSSLSALLCDNHEKESRRTASASETHRQLPSRVCFGGEAQAAFQQRLVIRGRRRNK